jgi:hypothetical protein
LRAAWRWSRASLAQARESRRIGSVTAFLQPRGLELSEQKTVITHTQEGFNFLGRTVRKYGDKLLITPAKSKVKGQAQPYHPQYTQYFEQRRCFAWRVR